VAADRGWPLAQAAAHGQADARRSGGLWASMAPTAVWQPLRGLEGRPPARAQTSGRGTFVPLVFQPGEAFQFDWSEDWAIIAGKQHQAAGGAHQAVAQPGVHRAGLSAPDPRDAVRRPTQAFRVLGGVPQRGIFDNMKTAVDKDRARQGAAGQRPLPAMASHYLFEPEFCNPASGWEKGQVEKNVQDARRRLWQPMPPASRISCGAERLARGRCIAQWGDPAWRSARHCRRCAWAERPPA
jgi:hypothetical protein